MKNTITKITYSLPTGKIKTKEFTFDILINEFLIQLKKNKCRVIAVDFIY